MIPVVPGVWVFTTDGVFDWVAAGSPTHVNAWIIGGGGGAQAEAVNRCGGGGAGRAVNLLNYPISGDVPVVVGAGGLGDYNSPTPGGDSSFDGNVAIGGGPSRGPNTLGPPGPTANGGSGGGGRSGGTGGVGRADGGLGMPPGGNNGGNGIMGTSAANRAAGGGGGAGAPGAHGSSGIGGAGGIGVNLSHLVGSVWGENGWFAGGGGGMCTTVPGGGGLGGGGDAGMNGGNGMANTGGGAGGGVATHANGGSGFVIVYTTPGPPPPPPTPPSGGSLEDFIESHSAYERCADLIFTRGNRTVSFQPRTGSFTQDRRRTMRWSGNATLSVPGDLLPTTPFDILSPFGTRVKVELSIITQFGEKLTQPFGSYILDSTRLSIGPGSQELEVTLIDIADALAKYRFETPYEAPPDDIATIINQVHMNRLGFDPELDLTGRSTLRTRVFGLDPEATPWDELTDLAAAFGYRLWYDRYGDLVLDQEPDPAGLNPDQVKGAFSITGNFEARPPNVVVARSGAADHVNSPVTAVVMDDDTGSPTYAGMAPGQTPYGRITRFYSSSMLTTPLQAEQAAQSILAASAAQGMGWSINRAFDILTDPDRVVQVPLDCDVGPIEVIVVVDAITIDMNGTTTIEGRSTSSLI